MSDPPIDEQEHDWFRARLDRHAMGMLDEAEERRFQSHAAACADCGEVLKISRENLARIAREGHIPARLLARWDRASSRLRGVARRMVREHLESCAECRQDLESVGFRPELEVVADLEGDPDPEAAPVPAPVAPAREIHLVLNGRRRWTTGWLAGAAGAALATAATLLVVSTLPPRPPPTGDPGPAMTLPPAEPTPAPAPAAAPPLLAPLPPPLELRGPHRGPGDEPVPSLRIGPDARYVQLALPELFLADSVTIDLRIEGPDGRTLLDARRRSHELHARRTLLFGSPEQALAAGRYRLVVRSPFAREPRVGDFRFDLVR